MYIIHNLIIFILYSEMKINTHITLFNLYYNLFLIIELLKNFFYVLIQLNIKHIP